MVFTPWKRANNQPVLCLGLIVAACILGSLPHAADAQTAAAAAAAAAAPQGPTFMSVALSKVQTLVETRYNWKVSVNASSRSIQVPVDSNVGWPQVRYKVTYSRSRDAQTVYTLSGQVVLTSKDQVASAIQLPSITVTTSAGRVFNMPPAAIMCPSLVVPAGGRLTCSFAASYAGNQPTPGTVSASVNLAGVLIPISLSAVPVAYDFSLADSVETGAFGTASNYFELGQGVLQPYGVYGEQPPPGLRLEDSREFNFVAVFGAVPSSKCGRQYKAVNTAELQPSSSDASIQSALQKSQVNLTVTLTGCDGGPPGFLDVIPATPAPATTPAAPVPAGTTPAAAWPPATPAAAPPAAAPAAAPVPDVPGISFAEAGSTLCGTGVCPAGQSCFNGWSCCPTSPAEASICGGTCCLKPKVCINNKCAAAGSVPCGNTVCTAAGEICQSNVCCTADRVVCGSGTAAKCCQTGEVCVLGTCAPAGSQACGQSICSAGQTCQAGVCCGATETPCAGRCCPAGNTCLQNQFCAPTGSSLCGNGQICNAPQQCAGGLLCCDAGASFCGGACCPSTSQCQAGRCLAQGQVLCGTTVCSQGQQCQGGTVCCDQGATFCNGACCPNGLTCINNQCVAQGSVACGTTVCPPNQICGNPQTGLCCQNLNQFGCGNACCNSFTQICDQYRQVCADRFNTACGPGQSWCAPAQQCCPVGQVCFNTCIPRNAIGRRLQALAGSSSSSGSSDSDSKQQ